MTSTSDSPSPLPPPPHPPSSANASGRATSSGDQLPPDGRLLGIDYGTRRLGLALSTPERSLVTPLENYSLRTERLDAAFLERIVAEYRIVGIVVGLPVHMSGDEGGKAQEAREFGAWVAEATGRPVAFCDERYTTAEAEVLLMSAGLGSREIKSRLDMVAAQIMLQRYLSRRAGGV